jgi:hypothetical protein
MTRRTIRNGTLGAAVAVALLAISTGSALAEDSGADDAIRVTFAREILFADTEVPREEPRWFSPILQLDEKSGFAYTRNLKMGNKALVLRIKGPYLRKQKALGLAFKINF